MGNKVAWLAVLGVFVGGVASARAEDRKAVPAKDGVMTDELLEKRIETRFGRDSRLGEERIAVDVEGGVVTLTGTVDDRLQKERAEALAEIRGVTKVENQLEVGVGDKGIARAGERVEAATETAGDAITDGWITAKVKSQMAADDRVKASDIDVDTTDRVVKLKGTVQSANTRLRALEIARNTRGVTRVVDELRVGRGHAIVIDR